MVAPKGQNGGEKMKAKLAIVAMLLSLSAVLSGGCDLDIALGGVPAVYDVYDVYVPAPVVYPVYDPCYYGCGDYIEVWYKQR